MSSHAEDVLFARLTDVDSIEELARIGLDLECFPTSEMRPVVEWAIDFYFASGMKQAPSREALLESWGTHIEDAGVELLSEEEEIDPMEWAIDALKSQYVHYRFQTFLKEAGTEMANAPVMSRTQVLEQQAEALFEMSLKMQPRHYRAEGISSLTEALTRYEVRAQTETKTDGLLFGMEQIDTHTLGIKPGELAICAAPPKTGKSFLSAIVTDCQWMSGGRTVLFSLENSIEMTVDRLVCLKFGIDAEKWQKGECLPEEIERVRDFISDNEKELSERLHIIMPRSGERTMSALVRQAQMLGADALLIDQLTFVDHPNPGRKPRHEVIRDLMHDLKSLISTAKKPLPTMLMHQIRRDQAIHKRGYLTMEDLAEGSEAERTADMVFGMYQSSEQRLANMLQLQILAARRVDIKNWLLNWSPSRGVFSVIREMELGND